MLTLRAPATLSSSTFVTWPPAPWWMGRKPLWGSWLAAVKHGAWVHSEAGQVDAQGRFNSTMLGDNTLLVGSGGANDVASTADEVVITMPASPTRLVKQLPYVTGPGERVTAVVTDLGIFEKTRGKESLRLTTLVGGADHSVEERVRTLKEQTGFEFEVSEPLTLAEEPREEELQRLQLFDPDRSFLGRREARDDQV